jgi:hypothetical protein
MSEPVTVPPTPDPARLVTDIGHALVHYASAVVSLRTLLPDHTDTLATVADALMRQQSVLLGVAIDAAQQERQSG